MNKNNLIQKYFQKKQFLNPDNLDYNDHLTELLNFMVNVDHGEEDITIQKLHITGNGTAQVISKQNGIITGIEEITYLFHEFTNLKLKTKITDGSGVDSNEIILSIFGKNAELLSCERILLNIIGRMSGIATYTHQLIQSIQHISHEPFLTATRKTPLMLLDKKAVAVGGGLTHRLNLSDEILIKGNHLKILQKESGIPSLEKTITEAVKRMGSASVPFFEIEVESLSQAQAAITAFQAFNTQTVMALLLDNFQPEAARQFVQNLKGSSLYPSILLEASGEITENNLSEWAKTGVDILSLGALTHSPKNFNLSMRVL